jgi:hypothetical protein
MRQRAKSKLGVQFRPAEQDGVTTMESFGLALLGAFLIFTGLALLGMRAGYWIFAVGFKAVAVAAVVATVIAWGMGFAHANEICAAAIVKSGVIDGRGPGDGVVDITQFVRNKATGQTKYCVHGGGCYPADALHLTTVGLADCMHREWIPILKSSIQLTLFLERNKKDANMKKLLRVLFLIAIAVFGIAFLAANRKDVARNAAMENPANPAELVRPAVNDPDAQVTEADGTLEVTYFKEDLTNWLFTEGFYSDLVNLVPKVFEKFPSIKTVNVTIKTNFKNIRGNITRGRAMYASFNRDNSASIHWDTISHDDVPKLADDFWAQRSLSTE